MATVSINLPACLPHSLHLWHWSVKKVFTAELQAKAELSSVKKRVMAQKLWDLSQQAEEKKSECSYSRQTLPFWQKQQQKIRPNSKLCCFWTKSLSYAMPGSSSQAVMEINISQFHGNSLTVFFPSPYLKQICIKLVFSPCYCCKQRLNIQPSVM